VAWRVTVRTGPLVERASAESLQAALDELERRMRIALAAEGRRGTVDVRFRSFAPGEQVIAPGDVRGPQRWRPSVRGGLDVRGDGGVQAWTGGARRAPVEPAGGETPFAALRRVLAQSDSVDP